MRGWGEWERTMMNSRSRLMSWRGRGTVCKLGSRSMLRRGRLMKYRGWSMSRRITIEKLEIKKGSFLITKIQRTLTRLMQEMAQNTSLKHQMCLKVKSISHLRNQFSLISILLKMMWLRSSKSWKSQISLSQPGHLLRSKFLTQKLLWTMIREEKGRTVRLLHIPQHRKCRLMRLRKR